MRLLLATAATLSLAATSLLATVTRTPFGHLPDGMRPPRRRLPSDVPV